MSLYFDGFFACDLKPGVPQNVIDVLKYMTRKEDYEFSSVPNHKFFETDGWRDFLRITAESQQYAVAPGLVFSDLQLHEHYSQENRQNVLGYTLSFRRTMHDDVECYVHWHDFLAWIVQYSDTDGFIGYLREQYSFIPQLFYFKKGQVFIAKDTLASGYWELESGRKYTDVP